MSIETQRHGSREPWPVHLPEFLAHLRHEGRSEAQVKLFRSSARHFLIWLATDETPLESVDDTVLRRFHHHDCRCVRTRNGHVYAADPERWWEFMSGAICLVRFLEGSGHIRHPGELDRGYRLLEDFLDQLGDEGYTSKTLGDYRSACRHFLHWLHGSRIRIREIGARTIEDFVKHECYCKHLFRSPKPATAGVDSRYKTHLGPFIRFLVERGEIPDTARHSGNDRHAEFEDYRAWLRQHRGIAERTIRARVRAASVLVADIGLDPGQYDATVIRDALLRRFARVSHYYARDLAVSMRMYLRFLASTGQCSPSLVASVPTSPGWRLTELPRYLPLDDIERVIGSCDITTGIGVRDRAILLLLARLALRGQDVSKLRLSDIDWRHARLQVCGKSRRTVWLPLPQDVGDALLEYIEHVRPKVDEERVFLRALPPHRPPVKLSHVVSLALRRAGVDSPSGRGTHLLRHSAATGLLRSGASLESIGTLLRHRSPDTTALYAKVDVPMLQEVAQPWIGDLG